MLCSTTFRAVGKRAKGWLAAVSALPNKTLEGSAPKGEFAFGKVLVGAAAQFCVIRTHEPATLVASRAVGPESEQRSALRTLPLFKGRPNQDAET